MSNLTCTCDESTIRKKFYKWTNENVFYIPYNTLINRYIDDKKSIKNLFIDSTVIENQNCNEELGFHYKIKNKKSIKVTTIVTEDLITVASVVGPSNETDISFVEPCINQLSNRIKGLYRDPVYLVADKGYISEQLKQLLKTKNVILVTPKRKNAKNKNLPRKHKILLKSRFKVEQ